MDDVELRATRDRVLGRPQTAIKVGFGKGGEEGVNLVGAQFDQFTITSKASLNGALNVAEINGFTPTPGETFDIVNFASKAGAFSSATGIPAGPPAPSIPPNIFWWSMT